MTNHTIGLLLIIGALVAFAVVVLMRRSKHLRTPPSQSSDGPIALQTLAPPPSPLTETEQLIEAMLLLDRNADARMSSLKVYLFFLPLIWGVISGIFWAIILALR
jgi:hypothetical protein